MEEVPASLTISNRKSPFVKDAITKLQKDLDFNEDLISKSTELLSFQEIIGNCVSINSENGRRSDKQEEGMY